MPAPENKVVTYPGWHIGLLYGVWVGVVLLLIWLL